jgi:hypothetical protein
VLSQLTASWFTLWMVSLFVGLGHFILLLADGTMMGCDISCLKCVIVCYTIPIIRWWLFNEFGP